ncbi:MAG: DUF411 domain-containing protein [Aquificaceae bacterium]|uniref:DUF411 domain-containing protein n=1 Tax=Hydrogenobacter sp. Uz 6-8 TaxID=3384828 RepID=UPI0030965B47
MKTLAFLLSLLAFQALAGELTAYYSPSCGCCSKYFSRLERDGFNVKRVEVSPERLMEIKSQLGVPPQLRSCHTMVYEGRFIEGHVLPEGVRRVIKDRSIRGVASSHGKKSAYGSYEESYQIVERR